MSLVSVRGDQSTTSEVAKLTELTNLGDPGADRVLFWDDSAGSLAYLTLGSGLTLSGTELTVTSIPGSGTVTSVSVVTANGVSGSVANATSTPAISITLGAITPTTIVASGAISGSNLSGTNTGDQTLASLGGANTALSNLAAVAINTTLVSDTDNTDALGTSAIAWSDLYLGSGSVITWTSAPSTADVTLTHSAGKLTFGGDGAVELDFNNHEMTNIDVNSGAIDGTVIGAASAANVTGLVITANTGFMPDADDGAYLGQSGTGFSDLFLASTAVINFGAGDVVVTHSANTLAFTGAATGYTFDSNITITVADTANVVGLNINQNDSSNEAEALHVTVAHYATSITFETTVSGSQPLPFDLYHNSASPANADALCMIEFYGNNSTPTKTRFAYIQGESDVVTAGSEAGQLDFSVLNGSGLARTMLQIIGSTNGIFVGANDAAGIVSSTGNQDLTLRTGNATTGSITITDGANGDISLTPNGSGAVVVGGAGIELDENAPIVLDAALSADGKYSGIVEAGTAGATLAFGDLVYLAAADSRWELADADADATSGAVKLGMCVLAAAADGSATTILLYGKIRADAAFPAFTISAPVYVSTTAGDVQVAQPSGTDDVIRIVGYGNTADELFFCPSNDYITHT